MKLLMCSPDHFTVRYAINPWMDVDVPVDAELAYKQWARLRDIYEQLGHHVDVLPGVPGLPDMVFTANAAVVHGGRALVANFTHPERRPESAAFLRWFREAGYPAAAIATERNEGQGDVLQAGGMLLAGAGPRTSRAAHDELRAFFPGVRVVSLDLVDPRFYHLDTALAVLDDRTIAYYPGAFTPQSAATLEELFPDPVRATEADACAFGLNAMSDGHNVVLSARAEALIRRLAARGFNPVGTDMSEFVKAGGSAKCCTLTVD